VTVFRFAIWDLADSLASLEELRERLPPLPDGHHWIANEAGERFGIVSFGEPPPAEALEDARQLIGQEPVAGEEFDVFDP
jgi:hypothetical protein